MINSKSLDNLRPFKKGRSGNPGGLPKLSNPLHFHHQRNIIKDTQLCRHEAGLLQTNPRMVLMGGNFILNSTVNFLLWIATAKPNESPRYVPY